MPIEKSHRRAHRGSAHRPVRPHAAARGRPSRRRGVPGRHRPLRRAGALARARPHLPAQLARAVERRRRRPRRRAGGRRPPALVPLPRAPGPAGRRGRDHGPLRPARLEVDPVHGLVLRTTDLAVLTEVLRAKAGRPAGRRPDRRPTPWWCPGASGAGSSRRCSRWAGRPRTWPATSTAPPTRSRCARARASTCAPTSGRPSTPSSPAAAASVVLPCGAGKTIVGLAAMARAGARTLILVTSTVAARQWRAEILARTSLTEAEVGEYSGECKEIRPVTLATYQILTTRRRRRLPPLRAVLGRGLGPDHLRRGPPAAGAGLPDHGRDPEPAPARPDRHPGPRGRPRGGRLQPDRPQEVRRAVARHRGAGLDRPGPLHRGAGHPARRGAHGLRPGRAREAYRVGATARSRWPWSRPCAGEAVAPGERILVIGQYLEQLEPAGRAARGSRSSPARRPTPSASGSTRRSGAARSRCWCSRRWATSPSTCPTPRWPSRSRAPSAAARRRPSAWAGSSGPRRDGRRPTSTRW